MADVALTDVSPLHWADHHADARAAAPRRTVGYTGRLAGRRGLRLHYGVDGWQDVRDATLEACDDGTMAAELTGVDGCHVVDCVVFDGEECDNNLGADHRLWLDIEPVDSHLHATHPGLEPMGFAAVRAALASAGIGTGIISWQDNGIVDGFVAEAPWLRQLAWVVPGVTPVAELRRRLAAGHVGIKLHPAHDEYPADDPRLDPYLAVAAEVGVPVAVHSASGLSDPDLIRRLADRHPTVRVLLYHTYLGWPEGRRRAARHAQQHENLYLETSWCGSDEVLRLLEEVGPERVLFGSDGAVDGPWHFTRMPPNLEGRETYNGALLRVVQTVEPDVARAYLRDNTRRLFRLEAAVSEEAAEAGVAPAPAIAAPVAAPPAPASPAQPAATASPAQPAATASPARAGEHQPAAGRAPKPTAARAAARLARKVPRPKRHG